MYVYWWRYDNIHITRTLFQNYSQPYSSTANGSFAPTQDGSSIQNVARVSVVVACNLLFQIYVVNINNINGNE